MSSMPAYSLVDNIIRTQVSLSSFLNLRRTIAHTSPMARWTSGLQLSSVFATLSHVEVNRSGSSRYLRTEERTVSRAVNAAGDNNRGRKDRRRSSIVLYVLTRVLRRSCTSFCKRLSRSSGRNWSARRLETHSNSAFNASSSASSVHFKQRFTISSEWCRSCGNV